MGSSSLQAPLQFWLPVSVFKLKYFCLTGKRQNRWRYNKTGGDATNICYINKQDAVTTYFLHSYFILFVS